MKGRCKVLCMLLVAMLTFGMVAETAVVPAAAKTVETKKAGKKKAKKNKKAKKVKKAKKAKKAKQAKKTKKAKAKKTKTVTTANQQAEAEAVCNVEETASQTESVQVTETEAAPQTEKAIETVTFQAVQTVKAEAAPVEKESQAETELKKETLTEKKEETQTETETETETATETETETKTETGTESESATEPQTTEPETDLPKVEQQTVESETTLPKVEQQTESEPQISEPETKAVETEPAECQHNWEWVIDVAPTCTGVGYKIQKCAKCGETKGSRKIVNPAGHDFDVKEVPGTCQTRGSITKTCKTCGAVFTEKTSYGSHTYKKKQFPCSQDACTVCGHVQEKTGKQGHDYCGEERIVRPATCTTPGEKVVRCKYGCGSEITVAIPATGHTYGNWERVKDPTCVEKGIEKRTCTCVGCDAEETREIDLGGHKLETRVTETPTCQKEGTEEVYCTACKTVVETITLAKTPHKLGRRCATSGCHTDEDPDGCDDEHCHSYVDTCVYCGTQLWDDEAGTWI